jgi:hypothetical protein
MEALVCLIAMAGACLVSFAAGYVTGWRSRRRGSNLPLARVVRYLRQPKALQPAPAIPEHVYVYEALQAALDAAVVVKQPLPRPPPPPTSYPSAGVKQSR